MRKILLSSKKSPRLPCTKKRRRVQRGGYGTAYCQFHIIIKYTARETNVKYQTKKKQKNYKKLSGMTLPQRDNRRLDGA